MSVLHGPDAEEKAGIRFMLRLHNGLTILHPTELTLPPDS